VHPEQREYPRASLNLPMRLRSAAECPKNFDNACHSQHQLHGSLFLCPRQLTVGASIELEIVLVSKPLGLGKRCRYHNGARLQNGIRRYAGWHGIAAAFDDVQFDRDDRIPCRYLRP